ncbi:hypothetical protein EYB25_004475 [Talaromyces marneffei]|nr:hypothetical protein EYB25_004475 [Talaromyces marneffei]
MEGAPNPLEMLAGLDDGFPNPDVACGAPNGDEAVVVSFFIAAKGELEAGAPKPDSFPPTALASLAEDRPGRAWPLPRPRGAPRFDWNLEPTAPGPRVRPPRPELTASCLPPRVAPKTLPSLGMGRAHRRSAEAI